MWLTLCKMIEDILSLRFTDTDLVQGLIFKDID
jgi:hypothetical protein